MNLRRENDILEKTLSIAEEGYAAAYRFLLEKYEQQPDDFGPQALYFLACLAGGDGQAEQALMWLDKSIRENGWWYRPEVLEDDDLASLSDNPSFHALKALSDGRYAKAVSESKAVFSWEGKFSSMGIHGLCKISASQRAEENVIARSSMSQPAEKPPQTMRSYPSCCIFSIASATGR